MARPVKPVDVELIKKLAERGCTVLDVAYITGLDRRTVQRRYAALIEAGKATLKDNLRSQMLRRIFDRTRPADNVLIFALKNYCDMSDKIEQKTTAEISGNVTYTTEWGTVVGEK